jgi:Ca2+-binding EF-hand superfamily protein
VTKLNFMLAAAVALGSAPALATAVAAAPAKPAAQPARPAAQSLTRAALTKQLDATFKAVDANGDGTLTSQEIGAAELKVLQQRAGMVRTRLNAEFTKLDTNKDGILSKAEFMAAAPQAPAAKPNGANAVAQLDKNKDGKVSADEYRSPILSRFDRFDSNHDGTLSPTEQQAAKATQRKRK